MEQYVTDEVAILTKFGRDATVMSDQETSSIHEEVNIPAALAGERGAKAAAALLSIPAPN